ncbi:hypothetical protein GF362_03855 [Candidatus Dojkabacteria bacterium]|nr:hypothetical protein [Candidatus Dojkabacteria bacterium]
MNVKKDDSNSAEPETTNLPLFIILIFVFIVGGFLLLAYFNPKEPEPEDTAENLIEETEVAEEKPPSEEQDEHGCLIAKGFVWCASTEKCFDPKQEECPKAQEGSLAELDVEKQQIVDKAKEYVFNMEEFIGFTEADLQYQDIIQLRCPGCWEVDLVMIVGDKKQDIKVTLEENEVIKAVFEEDIAEIKETTDDDSEEK